MHAPRIRTDGGRQWRMGMEYMLDAKGERRLEGYFDRIGAVLNTAPQRASFATYAIGLMGDGERKM